MKMVSIIYFFFSEDANIGNDYKYKMQRKQKIWSVALCGGGGGGDGVEKR